MAEPLFDPSLKKKKKKAKVTFNEDPLGADADPTVPAEPLSPGPTVHELVAERQREGDALKSQKADVEEQETKKPTEDDELAMFGDLKKKKKKKIPMDLDLEEPTPTTSTPKDYSAPVPETAGPTASAPPASDDFDLSDLKKKKKSSKKKAADLAAFEAELGDQDEEAAPAEAAQEVDDEDLGDDPFAYDASAGPAGVGESVGINTGKEAWIGSDRDYKYTELLERFFSALHVANPALASSMGKRYTIAPPQILRDGNKKSIFANIPDICRRMHRQPEHVIAFMLAEMGTTGSVDGGGRLVIKGRFLQKQVENVLRRYIVEYVTCKTCKSPDTILTKENRIYFVACESCGSRRSVGAIKNGFQAQVGKRSKNKTT